MRLRAHGDKMTRWVEAARDSTTPDPPPETSSAQPPFPPYPPPNPSPSSCSALPTYGCFYILCNLRHVTDSVISSLTRGHADTRTRGGGDTPDTSFSPPVDPLGPPTDHHGDRGAGGHGRRARACPGLRRFPWHGRWHGRCKLPRRPSLCFQPCPGCCALAPAGHPFPLERTATAICIGVAL